MLHFLESVRSVTAFNDAELEEAMDALYASGVAETEGREVFLTKVFPIYNNTPPHSDISRLFVGKQTPKPLNFHYFLKCPRQSLE